MFDSNSRKSIPRVLSFPLCVAEETLLQSRVHLKHYLSRNSIAVEIDFKCIKREIYLGKIFIKSASNDPTAKPEKIIV